ncbi:kinesin-13 [Plasmodium brasilianum]|uniref:Kinesin-13 n=1 Tax=Plasmodium brasilianum TaxID=5824 RepID=A0ACB9Y433_PLABR|nr:kinesin-13 [Plasmodium brasilianum]
MQQSYTFSDTSDFSSLDEMNCSLNNNDKHMFLTKKIGKQDDKLRNRSSCDTNMSKSKKSDLQLLRHSVGSKLTNFSQEKEKLKENSFLKNSNVNTEENVLYNMNNVSSLNEDINDNNNAKNTIKPVVHMRNVNEREDNKENDNIFFDAVSHYTDNYVNKFIPYIGQNLFNTNNNASMNYPYVSNSNAGVNNTTNYGNEMQNNGTFIDIKKRSTKGTNLLVNNYQENGIQTNVSMKLNALGDTENSANYISATCVENTNLENTNIPIPNGSANETNNINNHQEHKVSDYLGTNPSYGYNNNDLTNCNENGFVEFRTKDTINKEIVDVNNMDEERTHANKMNNFSNNDYLNQFQKNVNSMLDSCLNSLNITNLYEDTQSILNKILLSKYKADKDNVIKKYINEDINIMSLEQVDKYAQLIYEKRKVILNKLLFLFKKNVDIQTNNETSDLKKDLVMCHICSNNPDDQFHFYAYSRLEKDIINLIMLRQLWCESENLRLLHQFLIMEYQNKSASSILFNVPQNSENGSIVHGGVDSNVNSGLHANVNASIHANLNTYSMSKKYVDDSKSSANGSFTKTEVIPGRMIK